METLPGTLRSVEPLLDEIKLFFVDANSEDNTVEFLHSFIKNTNSGILLQQKGRGLYEALNQGISAALKDDEITHIGLLHSDDQLLMPAFGQYCALLHNDSSDVFYSDIQFHSQQGTIVRKWKAGGYSRKRLLTGWMPPHTSVIVRKSVYEKIGLYDPSFGTSADYQWLVRIFLSLDITARYFPYCTVSMRIGGASSSSIAARLRANRMDAKVWSEMSMIRAMTVRICKPIRKLTQFRPLLGLTRRK